MLNKYTNFTMTTFKQNKSGIQDAIIGGILLVALLISILFLFSLMSI